ncbi:LamG domain-containing protein, partial [Bacteroides heparinolyticus]
ILLDKALKQPVPVMDQSNKASTGKDMNLTTAEWSIETWVWMDGFAINNQAIINSGSGKAGRANEIYIRFGDAPIPYNSLQIKTLGSQVNTVTLFEPNKWYHLTITYDAGGLVTIYVNGEKDVTLQTKGGMVNFDQMELVTSGSWFRNTCKMGQLRLWKKAITPSQIKSNMYLGINPKNPDLMGYWRLDEGKGNVFKDATPNGFDMTAEGILKWETDVNFK